MFLSNVIDKTGWMRKQESIMQGKRVWGIMTQSDGKWGDGKTFYTNRNDKKMRVAILISQWSFKPSL